MDGVCWGLIHIVEDCDAPLDSSPQYRVRIEPQRAPKHPKSAFFRAWFCSMPALPFRRKSGSNFNLFLGKTVSFRQWAPKHKYKRPVNLPRGFPGILGSKVLWNVRACTRRKTHAHLSVEPQQRGNFLNMPRSSS